MTDEEFLQDIASRYSLTAGYSGEEMGRLARLSGRPELDECWGKMARVHWPDAVLRMLGTAFVRLHPDLTSQTPISFSRAMSDAEVHTLHATIMTAYHELHGQEWVAPDPFQIYSLAKR